MNQMWYGEKGYIELIEYVLENGVDTPDRTGVGCRKDFNHQIVYNVGDGQFPFSTIRPAPLRMAFEEFWFFMRGETDTKILEEKGITFWKGNTSRDFLDNRGLRYVPEGDMGKSYGYQWRRYSDMVDQLTQAYDTLYDDPFSRRIYTTFWNPLQSDEMALTPCWHSHLFNVLPDEDGNLVLNLKVFNRSLDLVFGYSFAVQQYALYLICMAQLTNMQVGTIVFDLSDVHIYHNQFEYANELIKRDFGEEGLVYIDKELNTLYDMISLKWDDVCVEDLVVNKKPFKAKRPPMAV